MSEVEGLTPGTLFGPYRIESRLGEGGIGAVYRATHLGLQKQVVLKVLHPQFAQSPATRARFAREGRAAAAIRHPHVVDVTDVGEHQGTPYLIMELLDGESLGALIERIGSLAADRAVDLLLPVIAAVDAAHRAGVVHRDLKPDNLFITRGATGEPFPKVLDFGISRVMAGDDAMRTGTAAMLGTPAYMAPEQIESTRDADARSDQYALGVILYECLTGTMAFRGDNVYAILKLVGDGVFAPPRALRPELPAALEAVVLRAMARKPGGRFPSLRAFAAALLPFASDRARITWGSVFSPGREHGPADTHLSTASAPPPTPTLAHREASPDTLLDAAHAQDSVTAPAERTRRNRLGAIALAAFGMVVIAAATTTALTREPRPAGAVPVAAQSPSVVAPTPVATPPAVPSVVPAPAPTPVPTPVPTTTPTPAAPTPATARPAHRRDARPLRRAQPPQPMGTISTATYTGPNAAP